MNIRLESKYRIHYAVFAVIVLVAFVFWIRAAQRDGANRRLTNAIMKDDARGVKAAVADGADPNQMYYPPESSDNTFSHQVKIAWYTATEDHDPKGAAKILTPQSYGVSMVMLAVEKIRPNALDALLAAKANPNALSNCADGATADRQFITVFPLLVASTDNSPDLRMEKSLLDAGANPNQTYQQTSAINEALVSKHSYERAKLLIDRGASLNTLDPISLYYPCKRGDLKTIKYLVSLSVSLHSRYEDWLLSTACENGHDDVVEYLLASGVPVNSRAHLSALWRAAANQHLSIVKLLLARGAHVNGSQIKLRGNYPLTGSLAQFAPNVYNPATAYAIAKALIDAGADVNAVDYNGKTALQYAQSLHMDKLAKLLIEHGAKQKP
jgi:ankyrin repeat protein